MKGGVSAREQTAMRVLVVLLLVLALPASAQAASPRIARCPGGVAGARALRGHGRRHRRTGDDGRRPALPGAARPRRRRRRRPADAPGVRHARAPRDRQPSAASRALRMGCGGAAVRARDAWLPARPARRRLRQPHGRRAAQVPGVRRPGAGRRRRPRPRSPRSPARRSPPRRCGRPIAAPAGDPYGPRGNGFHPGIDFPAATGTPITAAAAGRVVFAGYDDGWGLTVVIDHGNGLRTRYAHLSRAAVSVGQQLTTGASVGAVGATGLATGPHLHFEVSSMSQMPIPAELLGEPQLLGALAQFLLAGGESRKIAKPDAAGRGNCCRLRRGKCILRGRTGHDPIPVGTRTIYRYRQDAWPAPHRR